MSQVNHGWLYGNVKPYFEQKGIRLLKDDMIFIEKCLGNIPPDRHRTVMKHYFDICNASVAGNCKESEKPVNYRREANIYLRTTSGVKKCD